MRCNKNNSSNSNNNNNKNHEETKKELGKTKQQQQQQQKQNKKRAVTRKKTEQTVVNKQNSVRQPPSSWSRLHSDARTLIPFSVLSLSHTRLPTSLVVTTCGQPCVRSDITIPYWLTSCKTPSYLLSYFIIDHFYIALFSALQQAHCARMWFYMSE